MCLKGEPRVALGRCSVNPDSHRVMSRDYVSYTHRPSLLRNPTLATHVSCQCSSIQAESQLQ